LRNEDNSHVTAIVTPKNDYEKLSVGDFHTLKTLVIAKRISETFAAEIIIDFEKADKGIFICMNLFTFKWLARYVNGIKIESKVVKIAIIGDNTRYKFYTKLPIAYGDKVLIYDLPIENNDIDRAKWKVPDSDGQHVLFNVDLLSAVILLNQQFRMRLNGQEFNMALLF